MPISAPSFGLAFLAGLASFLSPCVFALVPAYVSYLGGRSMATQGEKQSASWVTLSHGFAFVIGLALVFMSLGFVSSLLGGAFESIKDILAKVGGVLAIVFGLQLTGLIHIQFLEYELRPQSKVQKDASLFSSMLMGVFFSAGWTPCVGPVLGLILGMAVSGGSPLHGTLLLGAYSAGLAIPFLLAATQIGWVTYTLRRFPKLGISIQRIMGILLIVIGVLLLSGQIAILNTSLNGLPVILNEGEVGLQLLAAIAVSLGLGALLGWWGLRRGKPFVDYWFLGTGISLVLLVALYLGGAFSFLAA